MEKSPEIGKLATALCQFQAEMEPVIFDASNPFFKSKYATLANLVSMAAPVATKHGLSVAQPCEGDCAVTTILMHTSGEYLCSRLELKPVKDDPQSRGAAITYARRFSYASILGLIAEADDDGNQASALQPKQGETIEPKHIQSQTIKELVQQMGEAKLGDKDKFKAWRVDNNFPEDLTKATNFELAKIQSALVGLKRK